MKFLTKTRHLIAEIESFWDAVSRAALIFKAGVHHYLDHNPERLKHRLAEIEQVEIEADIFRRSIKHQLYAQMLIPESRGDVLGLLESSDRVIDRAKKVLSSLDIEQPHIPSFLLGDFRELAEIAASAMDEMVKASRTFFTDTRLVQDYINKVYYYELEADKLEDMIKRKAFDSGELEHLSEKVHLRYFAEKLSHVTDDAEEVCERLSIYVIKRSV